LKRQKEFIHSHVNWIHEESEISMIQLSLKFV